MPAVPGTTPRSWSKSISRRRARHCMLPRSLAIPLAIRSKTRPLCGLAQCTICAVGPGRLPWRRPEQSDRIDAGILFMSDAVARIVAQLDALSHGERADLACAILSSLEQVDQDAEEVWNEEL